MNIDKEILKKMREAQEKVLSDIKPSKELTEEEKKLAKSLSE